MAAPETDPPASRWFRCEWCGDVIGVYEPLVHVIDGEARRTSRAAEPGIIAEAGLFYHGKCCELGLAAGAWAPRGEAGAVASGKSVHVPAAR